MSSPLSSKLSWELANSLWARALNPIVANAILSGNPVTAVLINGTNTINHGLGRVTQGFFITDINGAATIYRSQPMNASTLTLTSSAAVTVDLWIY